MQASGTRRATGGPAFVGWPTDLGPGWVTIERMTLVTCDADLKRCFREIDRDEVELPRGLALPLEIEHAMAWAVGSRAFLLFSDRPDRPPRGIVFHRNAGGLPDAAAMCEWCHSVRGSGGVRLMSVKRDERRHVGLYLCSDLGCVSPSREAPGPIDGASGPPYLRRGPSDVPERLDGEERLRRALQRISAFASRRVF